MRRFLAQRTLRKLALVLPILLGLGAGGCGDDDDDNGTNPPPGDGLVVIGMVSSVFGKAPAQAFVVVVNDGQPMDDATVTINDETLAPVDEFGFPLYTATLDLTAGDQLSLNVTSSAGNVTRSARLPGSFQITSPEDAAEFTDDQEIPVDWTAAESAEQYVLQFWHNEQDEDPYQQATGATNATIPASETAAGSSGEIDVWAVNGEGTIPLELNETNWGSATSGFYGVSFQSVSVTIN
jgi:hypothetical protein